MDDTHNDKLYPNGNEWMTKAECESVINECDKELEKNLNNESVLQKKIQACVHLKESGKFRMDDKLRSYAEKMMGKTYDQLINNFPTKKNLEEATEFFHSRVFTKTSHVIQNDGLLPLKSEPIPKRIPEEEEKFFTQFDNLPPNPGQFQCKKCNAIKNENEETCYHCDSKEFVRVKCLQCSSTDIAELIGGMALEPYDPLWKDIMQGKIKFGWGCVMPPPDEMKTFHCNACEFQW